MIGRLKFLASVGFCFVYSSSTGEIVGSPRCIVYCASLTHRAVVETLAQFNKIVQHKKNMVNPRGERRTVQLTGTDRSPIVVRYHRISIVVLLFYRYHTIAVSHNAELVKDTCLFFVRVWLVRLVNTCIRPRLASLCVYMW